MSEGEILNRYLTPVSDLEYGYNAAKDTVFSLYTQAEWTVPWLSDMVHVHKQYQFAPFYIYGMEQKIKATR